MPSQLNIFDGLIVDNFAGGGGASTGIELALGRPVDIAINHDCGAIAMHAANHPYTRHFCESVWDVNPREATQGQPVTLAWFSPDCTHFSKSRGGRPVRKNICGLAWAAVRWAATVRPRVIILENVEEFKTWGPLKNGQPDKRKTGRTFRSFINALKSHGYAVDWRELRACDYGAPTIRKRFFLIACCDGEPITWPTPTHGAPDSVDVKSGNLLPYRTAAEIIDWSLPCPSIFDTSEEIRQKHGINAVRPLAEATLRRIARGLQKFVIDNPDPYIVPALVGVGGRAGQSRPRGVDEPMATITSKADVALITPTIIQYHGEQSDKDVRGQLIDSPLMVVDSSNRYGLTTATLIQTGYGEAPGQAPRVPGLDKPLGTIVSSGKHAAVIAFLSKYYSGGHTGIGQAITEPLRTITSKDRFGLVTIHNDEYAIIDIGLRMLSPRELFSAQGFPRDYVIDVGADGKPITKSAQVARCGNSVCPALAEALVRANLPEMCVGKEALVRANLPEMCVGKIDTMYDLKMEMAV